MGIAMNILLSLSPFIAFFVLMRVVHPLAGLVGAFIVSLLLGVLQWRRGESVKVLEIGSLALQITAAWTAAFAVMAGADAAAQYVDAIPLWIDIAATVAAFAAAFWFTRWSSARARRRAASFANPSDAS
jgi:hypothetical protein